VKTLESLDFGSLVRAAVLDGLAAAAILDVDGKILAITGAVDDNEMHAIAAAITSCMQSADLLARMLDGELIESALDERVIGVGIAARCVFVVVVPTQQLQSDRVASDNFRSRVERVISNARADFSGARPPHIGSGGSSSGPAQLPVIEWGVTVRKKP
jgi:hypothetical protein